MSGLVDLVQQEDSWTFTLDRPAKMNALNGDLVEALIDGVGKAHARGVRSIIFRGAGKNFSAGFDFGDLETQSDGDLLLRFVRIETLLQQVAASPCLTVAFAHGRNFGAGVDLFAVCKRRYCAPDATFRMPGLKFGLVLGSRRLRDLVGQTKALEILQQALVISAPEAVDLGLATSLSDRGEWPALVSSTQVAARSLDDATQRQLYHALDREMPDRDLAALVRSAARPGLRGRIQEYLAAR
jgi:enoyl-CoA hydratase